MYKPQTIDQFKVWRFLDANFVMTHFLLSPVSRSALMIEDIDGDRMAFGWAGDHVEEQPLPVPASPEVLRAFYRAFWADPQHPPVDTFAQRTKWWLNSDTPLDYQQALRLPDELYRHYLRHGVPSEEEVMALILRPSISEKAYRGIQLWYLDGNAKGKWMGPLGTDGTGSLYGLTLDYGTPRQREHTFYLEDDYYRHMNRNHNI